MGAIEVDLNSAVDTHAMPVELDRVMSEAEPWGGGVAHFQVTDAADGFVRLGIPLSTVNAPTLFDPRRHVRGELVHWLQQSTPEALPRLRVRVDPAR